jgi:hypothetical protein
MGDVRTESGRGVKRQRVKRSGPSHLDHLQRVDNQSRNHARDAAREQALAGRESDARGGRGGQLALDELVDQKLEGGKVGRAGQGMGGVRGGVGVGGWGCGGSRCAVGWG